MSATFDRLFRLFADAPLVVAELERQLALPSGPERDRALAGLRRAEAALADDELRRGRLTPV